MPVQIATVQRRPAPVRTLGAVGDHQVGVQQRVALPGRPMVEPDRKQPLSGHVLDAAVATAGADVGVQVGDRLADAGVVGVQDRPAGRGVAEAVQERDALGGAQHHVEGGDGTLAVGAAEELAGVGVAAVEYSPEAVDRCFALQPEQGRGLAVPAAWGLTVAGQVLLVVGGELTGVVVLAACRQLGHVRYHPAAASSPPLAPANAPVVHCSPRTIAGRA
jgi:hypothetical protein